jgi:hypothetical protein
MPALHLRSRRDTELAEALLKERLVRRVIERLAQEDENEPRGVRRRLLATALRLTPAMAPDVHEIVESCRERLGVETPTEVYVYSSPQFNAACVKPEDGRLFILLSSSLLEAFRGGELRFVIGHEFGHHLFGHHDIPIGYILGGNDKPAPELALKLFSWSRFAEISADRAGAACADDPDAVARALFRLASGLRTDIIEVRIDDFAAQIDDMMLDAAKDPSARAPATDWFSTHPFSPLRVKALKHFGESCLAKEGGYSVDELEAHVQTLMALMEASYLDEKSDIAERMRRLLFAGAIAVANASDGISEAEIAVFEKFFGEGAFNDKLDVGAIENDLPARIADARDNVPPARRVQVLHDLCIVLRADGMIDASAATLLRSIATGLDVSVAIVDHALNCSIEPD